MNSEMMIMGGKVRYQRLTHLAKRLKAKNSASQTGRQAGKAGRQAQISREEKRESIIISLFLAFESK